VALLPIAAAPHAQGASPALLVLEKGTRSLAIVDPDRLEIVARVAAGDDPHEVVASEDGRFAYITILERAKGGDVSGWTMTHVPVGKGPEGFDVSPDGKELWAANSHDGTLSVVDVVDLRSLSVTGRVSTGKGPDGMAWAGAVR
jgi:YVTN family beta-propeller protein